MLVKHPVVIDSLDQFCGDCAFSDKTLCSERTELLIEQNLNPLLAYLKVVIKHPQCRRLDKLDGEEKEVADKWCGYCIWYDQASCYSREDYLRKRYKLKPQEARLNVMEKNKQCQKMS